MNAPSVMGRAGALGLCARADGVILLIDITTARRYAIIEARARLREAGVKLLGCVVIQQTKRQAQQQGSDRRQRVRAPHDVSAQPTIKQGAVERVRFSTSQTP